MSDTPVFPAVTATRLTGRTVRLDPLVVDRDGAALWQELGRHDDLWTHIPSGPFAAEGEFRTWLSDRVVKPEMVILTATALAATALTDGGAGDRVGGLYFLININRPMGVVEMGLVLGPALQRSVAATEAFRLLAGQVLEPAAAGGLGYRRLEWRSRVENVPSLQAARRFGFVQDGILREDAIRKGAVWSTAVFSLLSAEWPACAARLDAWLDGANFTPDGRQRTRLGAADPACE
ncbi:MAG: hypothetical protein RLY86_737 [Pseudomonadota bacterium]|jgi:RimJ/RimL family protein N-acetyltransferase